MASAGVKRVSKQLIEAEDAIPSELTKPAWGAGARDGFLRDAKAATTAEDLKSALSSFVEHLDHSALDSAARSDLLASIQRTSTVEGVGERITELLNATRSAAVAEGGVSRRESRPAAGPSGVQAGGPNSKAEDRQAGDWSSDEGEPGGGEEDGEEDEDEEDEVDSRRGSDHEEPDLKAFGPTLAAKDTRTGRFVLPRSGIWAAGLNKNGQLGIGSVRSQRGLAYVADLDGRRIASIAAGASHSIAITAAGQVYTWGANAAGQAVHRGVLYQPRPKAPVLLSSKHTQFVSAAASATVSVFASLEGAAFVSGGEGPLGAAGRHEVNAAVPLPLGTRIRSVACGAAHFLALASDGVVWAWVRPARPARPPARLGPSALFGGPRGVSQGSNEYGACGQPADERKGGGRVPAPRRVEGLPPVAALAAGSRHSLFLSAEGGRVLACGASESGQLGLGPGLEKVHEPREVPPAAFDGPVSSIAACGSHSAALSAAGTVYTWGCNRNGQLGCGTKEGRAAPGAIPPEAFAGQPAREITCGEFATAAVVGRNEVWLWGWGVLLAPLVEGPELQRGEEADVLVPRRLRVAFEAGAEYTPALGSGHLLLLARTKREAEAARGGPEALAAKRRLVEAHARAQPPPKRQAAGEAGEGASPEEARSVREGLRRLRGEMREHGVSSATLAAQPHRDAWRWARPLAELFARAAGAGAAPGARRVPPHHRLPGEWTSVEHAAAVAYLSAARLLAPGPHGPAVVEPHSLSELPRLLPSAPPPVPSDEAAVPPSLLSMARAASPGDAPAPAGVPGAVPCAHEPLLERLILLHHHAIDELNALRRAVEHERARRKALERIVARLAQ
eukprot:tig00000640_g2771.t1